MNRLWYKEPAKNWDEALPIGNGRLGAMIFGGIEKEHLQLNEESIWYGKPMDRVNPDALPNLEKVRNLILSGNIPEAEELMLNAFAGMPQGMRPYQTLGDAELKFNGITNVTNYRRELNLEEAVHRILIETEDGNQFLRETFASAVDGAIIMRLTSKKPGMLSASFKMGRGHFFDNIWAEDGKRIAYNGSLGEDAIQFCVMASATTVGGTVTTMGEHIIVSDATEAIFYLTSVTTYRHKEYINACRELLSLAEKRSYQQLLEEHKLEYSSYFNRFSIDLEYDPLLDQLPTNERLFTISDEKPDNGLLQTYLQFGRYLLISCSRPGTLPATLQGLWNKDMQPAWDSKYTININTEMNYWLAEIANLSDCHLPLFDLLEKAAKTGEDTAKRMYDCKGFVIHHNTDIWGDSAPQDLWIPGTFWVMGGAWLCTHVWEHYLFTKDINFLKKEYPTIKKAVEFFEDFLIEHNGYLVTCPSVSPENTYIMEDKTEGCVCASATMDNEILNDLFRVYINAAKELEVDADYVTLVENMRAKLPPIQVGKYGQIMEWLEDYEEKEPGHRHISQLYALYPSSQITIDKTTELAKAAEVTLQRRLAHGGGHTGWSLAWIINIYARLWDSKNAYHNLIRLMKQSTNLNLFNSHPPFQIDGNFGGAAGIIEMLVQSNADRVILLPALPTQWENGKVRGICLRGGAELTMAWEHGELVMADIVATHDLNLEVLYHEYTWHIKLKAGENYVMIE